MRRKKVSPTHSNHTQTLGLSWPATICEVLLNTAVLQLYRGVLQILNIMQVRFSQDKAERCMAWYSTLGTLSNHLQSTPPWKGTWTEPCTEALGRGRVTGQALGSRASPWHQNPHGISSIYSSAIIFELFGVLSNVPLFFPSPHPQVYEVIYACAQRLTFNRMLEKWN